MHGARIKLVVVLFAAVAFSTPPHVAVQTRDGARKSSWQRFERQGEYSVLMPVEPQPLTSKNRPGTEPDTFLARTDGAYYAVALIPHAGARQAVEPATRERVFDSMQGIALDLWKKSLKANFIYQRDLLLGGHRGREFNVDSPRYTGSVRMYLTAKRLYIVAFFREQQTRAAGEMEKFFDSFEIDETR